MEEEEEEGEGMGVVMSPSRNERDSFEVMSEVHLGCAPNFTGPHISHFTFPVPPPPQGSSSSSSSRRRSGDDSPTIQGIGLDEDEDGDLLLTRRRRRTMNCRLKIQHNITSSIPSVGLQVWRAELVLADFILHSMFTSSEFDSVVALELGAGTGLLGILLAHVAKTIFLTDHGDEVLNNCAMNVHLNSEMFKNHQTSVFVRELDWNKSWPPTVEPDIVTSQKSCKYSWTPSEVEEVEGASLLLAADVIYSDDLTDALFNTLQSLMSRGTKKVLFLALEKRYNFSLSDFDIVANGYSHFRSHLKGERECYQLGNGLSPCFVGNQIDITEIPQYVREYDREYNVEIWQIKYISDRPTD